MTPIVAGLSEAPDVIFLSDSRADRDAILTRHEESAARLYDLFKLLTADDSGVAIARPTVEFFTTKNPADPRKEVPLSSKRLIAAVGFVLGRLSLQNICYDRATELLTAAAEAMRTEKVRCRCFLYSVVRAVSCVIFYDFPFSLQISKRRV